MSKTRKLTHHKKHHIKSKSLKRTHKRKLKLVKKRRTRRKKNTKKRKMKGGRGWFSRISKNLSRKPEPEPQPEPEPEPEQEPEPEPQPEPQPEPEPELVITVTDGELNLVNKRLLTNLENKIEELKNVISEEDNRINAAYNWDPDMDDAVKENNKNKEKLKELKSRLENETYKTTKEEIQKKRNEEERRNKMSDYEKWQEDNPNSDPRAYFGGKRLRRKRRKTKKVRRR